MIPGLRSVPLELPSEERQREAIADAFLTTFDTYESLFCLLANDEYYYLRPEVLRHPLVFYFGHTAAFYVNKLVEAGIVEKGIDPPLEVMMAVGVDEMSWDDLDQSHYDWPSVDSLRRYREHVKELVLETLGGMSIGSTVTWTDPAWILHMGIEHERIHLETSSVLLRQLDASCLRRDDAWPICGDRDVRHPVQGFHEIAEGIAEVGRPIDSPFYGWDNEYDRVVRQTQAFRAAVGLVSCGDYRLFIADGGYDSEELWTDEGWRWRQYRSAGIPEFWRFCENDSFEYRTLLEWIPLPSGWPVDVNFHEATAYCSWLSAIQNRSFRLPSEDEWHIMRQVSGVPDEPGLGEVEANLGLSRWASASPVDTFPHGELFDVVGNVWQWTSSTINSLPGFRVHPCYTDFSTPTFDGQHNIIKGGSWISTGNEASTWSRYSFRRHFIQHAGFRIVEGED